MITLQHLCTLTALEETEVQRWIELALVMPEGAPGAYLFREVDVARVALIREMRRDLDIQEESVGVVLSLLDQLYRARSHMRRLHDAMLCLPPDQRAQVLAHLPPET